jgi:uncharacterized protein YqjF (DUF2071 family)
MTQTWSNLLFAHWPVDRVALRALVPEALELDLFDGDAWVGVVPFYMTNVAPRGVPAMPWVSEFPELNVRTYVRVGAKPGVYFISLDAASRIAVRAARLLLNLPYQHARMSVESRDDVVCYESRRNDGRAELRARYRPTGPSSAPAPGSLEYFLTERYCLYHLTRAGRPYRLEIHHPPWPLQQAEAEIERNTMASASRLSLRSHPPLLHFVARQDMVAWPPDYLTSFTVSIC